MKADACFKLLGTYLDFYVGKEEHMGRLISVRIDSNEMIVVGVDEDGFIEEYEISSVNVVQKNKVSRNIVKQIVKQINRDINSFKYDLIEYRKSDLTGLLERISDVEQRIMLASYLETETANFDSVSLYEHIQYLELSQSEKDFLCGAVAYKQHDAHKAYEIFSKRWLMNSKNLDCCRDFLLVADEFDNDVLCFYLLKQFFKSAGRYLSDRYYANLWWKYLFYATKYNNFDLLENIEVTSMNVRILFESCIYIFHTYNLDHIAMRLINLLSDGNNTILQRNNEDFGDLEEAIDELSFCKHYIPDTAEGYYLRFEICMNRILMEKAKTYSSGTTEERSGYIYEYVKSRNYGFIIGNDFQKYFYHWDDLTLTMRKRIMDNIYSGKKIEDEDRIYVQFRTETANRRIRALDII